MARVVNLRSDTVTKPTAAMRRAMAEAEVGDDYYRDDPTVRALEEKAAPMFGKEAAMLVFSTTMADLVSVLSQASRGHAVILKSRHTSTTTKGVPRRLRRDHTADRAGSAGAHDAGAGEGRRLSPAVLHPQTRLLCLEDTHNAAGGCCLSLSQVRELCGTAASLGLNVHLDGARIFNAAVSLGVSVRDLTAPADSLTVCLTKALGCPVGALVLGRRDLVETARRWRQATGGGMRQAGVFAAAGIVALDTMVDRLAEDHAYAKRLAILLAEAGLQVDPPPEEVETNIVFAEVPAEAMDASAFVAALGLKGVVINGPRGRRVRFITHHDVSADDVEFAGACVRDVLGAGTMSSPAS